MPFEPNSNYIKSLVEDNDKVTRFLNSCAEESQKTAQIYGTGLAHFSRFLNGKYTLNQIVESLQKQEVNVYDILEDFVSYLRNLESNTPNIKAQGRKLSPRSILTYVNPVRSYLQYNDIDIVPAKYKRRVKIKIHKYDEEPIDSSDIRSILQSVNSERLKAYLLCLASGGMRAMEAVAIRFKDIDFSVTPTKIHIRPEHAKTRVGRDIYISEEATKYLKEWIDYRFRDRKRNRDRRGKVIPKYEIQDKDLVFKFINSKDASLRHIYHTLSRDFNDILNLVKMNQRKEGMLRRQITLNSFRRFVKTVISTQVGQDYSEYFLGHAKSSYWTMKESERRQIYVDKCMKYLTFLDYATVESVGKDFESKLTERDQEIEELQNKIIHYEMEEQENKKEVENMRDYVNERVYELRKIVSEMKELRRKEKIKETIPKKKQK